MKLSEAFPSNFLKSADLQNRRVVVTISHLKFEELGDERKPVLHFRGKDKGLVLNKTNANAIWGINGSDDTDDWPGTSLTLYPSKTDFQGKRVDCIRIDPPDSQPQPRPQASRVAPMMHADPLPEDDDSVPF